MLTLSSVKGCTVVWKAHRLENSSFLLILSTDSKFHQAGPTVHGLTSYSQAQRESNWILYVRTKMSWYSQGTFVDYGMCLWDAWSLEENSSLGWYWAMAGNEAAINLWPLFFSSKDIEKSQKQYEKYEGFGTFQMVFSDILMIFSWFVTPNSCHCCPVPATSSFRFAATFFGGALDASRESGLPIFVQATLQGTNISPKKLACLKMMFLFPGIC